MAQGKVVAFLRSLPGQTLYWLPGQLMANSKMYRPDEPLHKKFEFFFRRKAIWEMAALSATICGIEFCYSAETAFVSPILRLLGTPTYFTSMVWGCSPILGVFVTPIFGSLSDACNSRFGRRRPFIVALSLIVLLGLACMGSAVSIAQKTEAEIMSQYYKENSSTSTSTSTSTSSTRRPFILEPLKHEYRRQVNPDIFAPFPLGKRRKNLTTTTTQIMMTTTEPSTDYEDTTQFYSTSTRLRRMSTITTPEPGFEPTATPDRYQRIEAEIMGGEAPLTTTTEIPPTSAAVHQLPIGMAILGVILMDFGCDASQSPCRTYLLDVCLPEDHRLGLRTFTVSAGLGGTIGYLMGGIDLGHVDDTAAIFFQHLKTVYIMIGILFVLFVFSTIFVFKEPTLEEWHDLQAIANETQEAAKKAAEQIKLETGRTPSFRKLNRQMSRKLQTGLAVKSQPKQPERLPLMATKSCSDAMQQFQVQRDAAEITREESEASFQYGSNNNSNLQEDVSRTKSMDKTELDRLNAPKVAANEPKEPTFLTYIRSIRHMPRSVALVCLTNYFSWMSLVCYSLYFTDYCGEIVFDGEAAAPYGTPDRLSYEQGVRFGACGMSLYSLTCCIYSLFAEKVYKKIGLKFTYALGPSLYSLGLLCLIIMQAKWAAIFVSLTAGLMYSTLFTMPYILIGKYHSHQMFEKLPNEQEEQAQYMTIDGGQEQQQPQPKPPPPKPGEVRGLGTDIALVSSMVFLAQFTVALIAGPLSHAMDTPIVVFVMGALAAVTTAVLSLRLYYPTKA